jgi:hypothetical protein
MLGILDYFNYIYKQERKKEQWVKSPESPLSPSSQLSENGSVEEKKNILEEDYDKNLLTSTLEGIAKDAKITNPIPLKTKILYEIGVALITFLILFVNTFLYFGGGLIKEHLNYSLLSTALVLIFLKINKHNALMVGIKNIFTS